MHSSVVENNIREIQQISAEEAALETGVAWRVVGEYQKTFEANKKWIAAAFDLDGYAHRISLSVMPVTVAGERLFRPCLIVDLKGRYPDTMPAEEIKDVPYFDAMASNHQLGYGDHMVGATKQAGQALLRGHRNPEVRKLGAIGIAVYG